jgi:hypothetical protein
MKDVRKEFPFINHSQRAFALWKSAEIRLLAEADPGTIAEDLEEALEFARKSGSSRTEFWILVTMADWFRTQNPGRADAYLRDADALRASVGIFGLLFLLLQRAELEMFRGDLRSARAAARRAWWLAAFRYRMPSAALASRAILARSGAGRSLVHRRLAVARLNRVRRGFRRIGMRAAEARTEIQVSELIGRPLSGERVRELLDHGWEHEEARAAGRRDSEWHVIM